MSKFRDISKSNDEIRELEDKYRASEREKARANFLSGFENIEDDLVLAIVWCELTHSMDIELIQASHKATSTRLAKVVRKLRDEKSSAWDEYLSVRGNLRHACK